jgi:hypothetical protein
VCRLLERSMAPWIRRGGHQKSEATGGAAAVGRDPEEPWREAYGLLSMVLCFCSQNVNKSAKALHPTEPYMASLLPMLPAFPSVYRISIVRSSLPSLTAALPLAPLLSRVSNLFGASIEHCVLIAYTSQLRRRSDVQSASVFLVTFTFVLRVWDAQDAPQAT